MCSDARSPSLLHFSPLRVQYGDRQGHPPHASSALIGDDDRVREADGATGNVVLLKPRDEVEDHPGLRGQVPHEKIAQTE